ncbi:MAG: tRNA pseudouridine(38-40) synthase TruA [Legionellales bacterium]|nr:tRNA pseudouridine(38-40) synthase TruA [Legionellales bacterium]
MRLAFGVQYIGTNYSGWQKQPNGLTIQEELEKAFSKIADEEVMITGSGRTDAGVHASGQICHFDSNASRSSLSWVRGVNRLLPSDINVTFVTTIDKSFHARFSAVKRRYVYLIYNNEVRSSFWGRFAALEYLPLDEISMHKAAQLLLGEKDFTSVRDSGCQSNTPIREIYKTSVIRKGNIIRFEIVANAFLHHMVRNILGLLIPIGLGDKPIRWVKDVINAKDRGQGGLTYSPKGLYLHKVYYEKVFSFKFPRQDYIIDLLS